MIRLDQPRRWDLVGSQVMIAGIGTGFEAVINYRITEGHDEITGYIMVGGGTGEHGQFQRIVNVAGASFTLDRIFVEVYETSAKDGSELHKVTRPVLLGARMVEPRYIGYREHEVKEGETLIDIARQHYGENDWQPISRANVHELHSGTDIFPGQVLRIPVGGG